jgi:hypothetical protein
MQKRISKKHPTSINQATHYIATSQEGEDNIHLGPATQAQISAFMAEMGRKGGKIGGKRRLETMTAKERSEIATKAAKVRWGVRKHNVED